MDGITGDAAFIIRKQDIVTLPANQGVVTRIAKEKIRLVSAMEQVIARTTENEINAIPARQGVLPTQPHQAIISETEYSDHIIGIRSDDWRIKR